MDKKKILFINGHLNAGGVERSLVDVLRHFDYTKYEVDLLLLEEYGDYLSEVPQEVNVIMYPLNEASGAFFPTLWRNLVHGRFVLFFYRLLMLLSSIKGNQVMRYARSLFRNGNKQYDVVIGYRPNHATTFAAYTFHAKKRLAWWHHGEMNIGGTQRKELGKTYKQMDAVVAVSESSAQIVKETFPDIKEKVLVIPNMLCVEEIRKKASAFQVQVSSSVFNIVSVGRMSPEKNMIFCVDVAKNLKELGFAFHWYLIGDGVEMDLIQKRIDNLNLSAFFTITGRLSNPYSYMQSADVLFHPSLVESQGLTVLEAMALSTPVVVVETSGTKEFVVNEENGFLIMPDEREAVSSIIEISEGGRRIGVLAEKGILTVNNFLPEKIVKRIELLIFEGDDCQSVDLS